MWGCQVRRKQKSDGGPRYGGKQIQIRTTSGWIGWRMRSRLLLPAALSSSVDCFELLTEIGMVFKKHIFVGGGDFHPSATQSQEGVRPGFVFPGTEESTIKWTPSYIYIYIYVYAWQFLICFDD